MAKFASIDGVRLPGEKPPKVHPLPEVLERGGRGNDKPWRIEEIPAHSPIGGGVMPTENLIIVPLDPNQIAENIRAHEMAHIQWSRKYPKNIPFIVMNAAEDMRINTKLVQEAGVNIASQGLLNDEWLAKNIAHFRDLDKHPENMKAIVTTLMSNYPTGQGTTLYGVLNEEWAKREREVKGSGAAFKRAMRTFDKAVEYLRAQPKPLSWDTAVNIARYVDQVLSEPPPMDKDSMEKSNKPMGNQPLSKKEIMRARGMSPADDGEESEEEEGKKDGAKKGEKKEKGEKGEGPDKGEKEGEGEAESYTPDGEEEGEMSDEFAQGTSPELGNGYFYPWGALTIEPLRTRIALPGSFFGKQWKPTNMGVLPKFMNRWATDKEIWGYKKRVKGGTVLIDASGSMRLNKAEVYDVMRAAPGATVAIYSGNGRTGVLRFLVYKNKRVDDTLIAPPGGGDNTVDGPALRWLLKQKGPRVWISDGQVVGVGGQGPGNMAEADLLCKRGRVMRVLSCPEAVTIFRRLNAR